MDFHNSHQIDYMNNANLLNSQLQDFSIGSTVGSANPISGSSTPLSGVPQIHRSVSLMDTLGIQRTHSPFHNGGANESPSIFSQQNTMNWSMNSGISTEAGIPFSSMGTGLDSGSAHNPMPLPPGIVPNVKQVSWQYLDHSNQVQGPFDSDLMDKWYNAGFFNDSLHLMPINCNDPFQFSGRFIILNELLSKTGNINPFHAFDMICTNHAIASSASSANGRINFSQDGSGGNMLQPQVISQSQSALAELTNAQSKPFDLSLSNTTITSSSTTPVSLLQKLNLSSNVDESVHVSANKTFQSPDLSHSQVLQLKTEDGSYYQNTTVSVPFSKHVQIVGNFNQPPIPPNKRVAPYATPNPYALQTVPAPIQPVPEAVQTLEQQQCTETSAESFELQPTAFNVQDSKFSAVNAQHQKAVPIQASGEAIPEPTAVVKSAEPKEDKKKKKDQKSKTPEEPSKIGESSVIAESKSEQIAESSPWIAATKPVAQTKSLSDIQRRDFEDKKRREAEREKQELEAALKLQRALLAEEQKTKTNVSSVASWGNPTGSKISVKNVHQPIKDLQTPGNIKYIEEQRKILEDIQRSKTQVSTPSADSWSTIAKKKTTTEPARAVPQLNNSFLNPGNSKKKILHGSAISIPTLKKGATATSSASYAGNQSTSARKQFLNWCRSQMKLAPGVKVDSVLEMLLSLPPSMDAKEIISDTIYANSAVMEGRSFALEFIKRRIDCEKSLNDPLTWSEALTLPQGSSDDWEFQVVSKKKGKKN
ncbi:unnamed protein product [Kluyveromyces dobzhanskii CBS 2104]|uniref:WGS project CCBQ000000000 data, contig 00006 n=1 Tax=Kluyveromyces dobzhanskii CBS 2104 TaxID=1427455 RepID=A0A0A8L8G3_9SACH|nr:unnamed protein product [Kluyveromyces dobzhanskii CBS 2104]